MFRFNLILLLFLQHVFADCSASTTTIQGTREASALASCTTYTGSIAIATDAVGDIVIDNVEVITGSLVAYNVAELISLTSSSLRSLDTFVLQAVPALSTVSFPRISQINSLQWAGVTNLTDINFNITVPSISTIIIEGTYLESLDKLGLQSLNHANEIRIVNNPYLESFPLPLLYDVTSNLMFGDNGDKFDIFLPSLEIAGGVYLYNISSFSINMLKNVSNVLQVRNTKSETILASQLARVGSFLDLSGNSRWSEVTLPGFNDAGNILIDGSPNLTTLRLDTLQNAAGNVSLSGSFSNTSLSGISLQNLQKVTGKMSIETTGDMDCSSFQELAVSGRIEGGLECTNSSGKTVIMTTENRTSSESLSTGAKVGIGVGVAGGAIGLISIGTSVLMLQRSRKRSKAGGIQEKKEQLKSQPSPEELTPHGVQELEGGQSTNEMDAPISIVEAEGSRVVVEMPGDAAHEMEGDWTLRHDRLTGQATPNANNGSR